MCAGRFADVSNGLRSVLLPQIQILKGFSQGHPIKDQVHILDAPRWALVQIAILLHNALMDVVTARLHLLVLLLLPFWCGGLCAAHGIRRTSLQCPGVSDPCVLIYC